MDEKPIVIIPTVTERILLCEQTIQQWRNLGYVVIASCLPADIPRTPEQHGKDALALLRTTQQYYPGVPLLFCEDDVALDSRLASFHSTLQAQLHVVTLYLPGKQFYPARFRRVASPELPVLFPIVSSKQWFGSQCLYLPGEIVGGLLHEQHEPTGFDLILRSYLQRHALPLYSVFPNLVQHLAPPSVTSKRYRPHRSTTWMTSNAINTSSMHNCPPSGANWTGRGN
jgi:hypothetical protein